MARYWFRPRRYGYGATPVTWEGWALTVAVVSIVAISVAAMNLLADRANFAVWIAWRPLLPPWSFRSSASAVKGPMASGAGDGMRRGRTAQLTKFVKG
jgi:hypothetical protein